MVYDRALNQNDLPINLVEICCCGVTTASPRPSNNLVDCQGSKHDGAHTSCSDFSFLAGTQRVGSFIQNDYPYITTE